MNDPINLELSPVVMREMAEAAVRAVVDHIAALPSSPRSHLEGSAELVRSLRELPPEIGTDFRTLLEFLMTTVVPASINTPHPQYLAYIPGGGLYPSAVADFIGAATNRYTGVWFAAPAAVRLETNVLEWFARWMGYPESARGILTTGGSMANFSAVVTARKQLLGDDIARGTIYASDQTHYCVMKVAALAGIPERNVRLLDTDERYRAVPELFEKAIRADVRAGFRPFLLVGNAGTTNTGAVDPLAGLAEVAKRHGLWYHVDAAYGGFFNLCEEGRRRLAGLELSDSMVLDPHKGLFIPYGSGSLLVKDGEALRRAHVMSAEYLQDIETPEDEVSPADYSPELSRANYGLRVWLPLKFYGVKAFRENLAEKLRLAEWLYHKFLEEPGFEIVAAPELSVVAYRYRPKSGDLNEFNRRLIKKIVASRKLFLSSTMLRGRFVLRACVLSFRTHQSEIEEAFETIVAAARQLAAE
jgi:aromatic-L-amino-acid/L-tryptophan decarboxylase